MVRLRCMMFQSPRRFLHCWICPRDAQRDVHLTTLAPDRLLCCCAFYEDRAFSSCLQQAISVGRMASEAALSYTVSLLPARCASRGQIHYSPQIWRLFARTHFQNRQIVGRKLGPQELSEPSGHSCLHPESLEFPKTLHGKPLQRRFPKRLSG